MAAKVTKLSVVDTTIKTATVQIQTLTLNGKQVTLSVFRQLPRRDLHGAFLERRGTPWGRVNYFFGQCESDHLHVIWQDGNELCRACVFPRFPHHERAERAIGKLAHDHLLLEILAGWEPSWRFYSERDLTVACNRLGKEILVVLTPAEIRAFPTKGRRHSYLEEMAQEREKRLSEARQGIYTHLCATYEWDTLTDAPTFCAALLWPVIDHWRRQEERWQEEYRALQALDQLFIAV